jgi:hypothetical protein
VLTQKTHENDFRPVFTSNTGDTLHELPLTPPYVVEEGSDGLDQLKRWTSTTLQRNAGPQTDSMPAHEQMTHIQDGESSKGNDVLNTRVQGGKLVSASSTDRTFNDAKEVSRPQRPAVSFYVPDPNAFHVSDQQPEGTSHEEQSSEQDVSEYVGRKTSSVDDSFRPN